ncbi:hypothetical protein [Sorangium sp. So ce1078]|uniref:hypothetical protein n=1 Tax=Sorangium sp. So ce1078 TaxID=3133329 RepID=UPI003F5E1F62
MSSIDGFVAAVETASKLAFIDHAKGVDAVPRIRRQARGRGLGRRGSAPDDAGRLDCPGH